MVKLYVFTIRLYALDQKLVWSCTAMLKKLLIWTIVFAVSVHIWKHPEFQQYKEYMTDKIWFLAAESTNTKINAKTSMYFEKMQFWMENFTTAEKDLISELSQKPANFHSFISNYCQSKTDYHPVLSKQNLKLACKKALELKSLIERK